MVRPPGGPLERASVVGATTPQKPIHFSILSTEFARWLKRDPHGLGALVGEPVELDKNLHPVVAEGVWRPAPPPRAPELGANDSTQKSELDPLELSLSVPLGGSQPVASVPVSNALHDASSSARPLLAADAAMIEEVVRRISWGGDRRRGAARIELGGAFSGTTIVVHGEGRAVELDIELAPGTDAGALPARLAARLAARGLEVRSVDVR